jgi:hypothetical protein
MKPKSELILYQTEDNRTRIEVRLENETVWLTQTQMAELFQTTIPNVSMHIRNILAEEELQAGSVVKEFLTTAAGEAKRKAELEFDKFEVRRRRLEDAGAEAGFAQEVENLTKAAKQIKPAKRKK